MAVNISDKSDILVVDDDKHILHSVAATLISSGMPEPLVCADSRRVVELLQTYAVKLVLLDILMPEKDGIELLTEIKEAFPEIECVMVTAVDDVPTAVRAMKYGALDYLVKPFDPERLISVARNALQRYELRYGLSTHGCRTSFQNLKHPEAFEKCVARDDSMAMVFHQVEMIAPTDYSVLISGESGTGKEMLARIIHELSRRSFKPFVGVNMASFNAALFEDDFFGHARGAYTGAETGRSGFFETATGGTLFLDEITEMGLGLQAKLLRVIQEEEFYRLGTTCPISIDVRIIAAGNTDYYEEIDAGRFRKDLFYRLNTCHIHVPPLRKRKKDILALGQHFLEKHARKNNKPIRSLTPEVIEYMMSYPFPGNVRELDNIIAGAVLIENGQKLTLHSVISMMPPQTASNQIRKSKLKPLADLEKDYILRVLEDVKGNRTKTAKILGIGLRTLQRRLKEYGIND